MAEKKTAGKAQGAAPAKAKAAPDKAAAEPVEKVAPEIPTETFKANKKVYRFKRAQFIVPGFGKLTAQQCLDMAAAGNKEPLAVLADNESSVIEEVEGEGKEA